MLQEFQSSVPRFVKQTLRASADSLQAVFFQHIDSAVTGLDERSYRQADEISQQFHECRVNHQDMHATIVGMQRKVRQINYSSFISKLNCKSLSKSRSHRRADYNMRRTCESSGDRLRWIIWDISSNQTEIRFYPGNPNDRHHHYRY